MPEPVPTSSLQATLSQGGAAGSAVARLHSASARHNTKSASSGSLPPNPPPPSSGSNPASPTNFSLSDDADEDAGSDNENFDVVNPLYEHGARRLALPPRSTPSSSSSSLPIRLLGVFREYMRTPNGRVTLTLPKASPELRICASLNGCADSTFDPAQTQLQCAYYRVGDDAGLGLTDVAELQVAVNRRADDAFVGVACVAKVDELPDAPVLLTLELLGEGGARVGTLEVFLQYRAYSVRDALRMHGERLLAVPAVYLRSMQRRAMLVPAGARELVRAGLPGLHGGAAASWVIFLACTLPFWVVSLLTNLSWATRQWFLVVPVYCYFSLSLPVMLGWLVGTLITVFAMHGYPGTLKMGAVHLTPWVSGWALQLRVTVFGLAFGNPPGFPLENFLECRRIDVAGQISFQHILDLVLRRYKKCPLKKVPDFRYLAKFDIEYVEFEDFMVDFQMYDGKFNVHAFTRILSEGEAKHMAWMKGYMKAGDPMPNELEIRIIRCKDLVKTKTSKRTLRQQMTAATQQGPLGHNAVIEAFAEDEDVDADEEEPEAGGSLSAGGGGGSARTSRGSKDESGEFYGGLVGPAPPAQPAAVATNLPLRRARRGSIPPTHR
jgi:hypothetical protein